MGKSQPAKFSLRDYKFKEFNFKAPPVGEEDNPLDVTFIPSGKFFSISGDFELNLIISCVKEGGEHNYINVVMSALFHISDNDNKIPDFFYANSIAIIFPYIRAFVSTLTLQSNEGLVILPTLNLSNLEKTFRENTEIIEE